MLKERDLKMLERVRDGLDTDSDLSEEDKKITQALYQGGYIGAAPVEGSDTAQDGLWITATGLEALGLVHSLVVRNPYKGAGVYLENHKEGFTEGVQYADKEVAAFFDRLTDDAVMRAVPY